VPGSEVLNDPEILAERLAAMAATGEEARAAESPAAEAIGEEAPAVAVTEEEVLAAWAAVVSEETAAADT
jgi:hypothetical protein